MTRPSVSVAMATYNGVRHLESQLRSIFDQTRPPDEIIISDGGSDDGTVGLARDLLGRHPEVPSTLIADGARLGVTANFARAVGAASGELIALSDQDDVWRHDRLDVGVAALAEGALLTHSDARLVDDGGTDLGLTLFGAIGLTAEALAELSGDAVFRLLIRRNLITGATTMFRRDLLAVASPFPETWVHDEWLAILAAAVGRIAPSVETLIDYRQHETNAIGVVAPTLRYRVGRMLESRGDRYALLAARARDLEERLDAIGAPDRWRALSARKRAFEERRSGYARARIARIGPIAVGAVRGDYRALSSQGDLDVLRDVLQPA